LLEFKQKAAEDFSPAVFLGSQRWEKPHNNNKEKEGFNY
jgi:hypothetical protein